MNIKDRLLVYLKYRGLGQNKFESLAGIANGYISKLKTSPSVDILMRILNAAPDLSRDWLMTGEGPMLLTDEAEKDSGAVISYTDGVPYYDEDFLLGFDELVAPSSESPDFLIRMPGYERATLWCNASGRSMEPEISNGDKIALQLIEDFSFLPYGEIYGIITTNGQRTIKRLGRASRDGYYRLIPTNREYDEQEIPAAIIARIYRVLGVVKAF